jgi:hypothetical protein
MHRDESPTDVKIREAEEHLLRVLKEIKLTPLEQQHVNEAAKILVDASWKFFESLPEQDRIQMRSIVTTIAIANSLGIMNLD